MSAIADLHSSLAAMGAEQQACVFVFLMSYPLTLGALVGTRGRRVAAAVAAGAALGFIATSDPWMYAVLLVAAGLASVGVFIAAAYVVNAACARLASPVRSLNPAQMELPLDTELALDLPLPQPARARELAPLRGTVAVKS